MLNPCVVCDNIALLKGINAKYLPPVDTEECFVKLLKKPNTELHNPLNVRGVAPFEHAEEAMRSSYERGFANWLIKHNIMYMYEPYIIKVQKTRFYVPDFYLPDSKIFIEVKGKWEGSAKAKFRYFEDQYEWPIFVIDKEAMRMFKVRPEKGELYGVV